jgi:hypothetical protein
MVKVLSATDADADADAGAGVGGEDAAWALPPAPIRPSAVVAAAASPRFLRRLLWMFMGVLLVIVSTCVDVGRLLGAVTAIAAPSVPSRPSFGGVS